MEEVVTRREVDYCLAQLSAYFALQLKDGHENPVIVDLYKSVNKIKEYIYREGDDDLK